MAQKKGTDPFLKKLEEEGTDFQGPTAKAAAAKAPLKKPDPMLDKYEREGILGSKPGATLPLPDTSGVPVLGKIVDEAMNRLKEQEIGKEAAKARIDTAVRRGVILVKVTEIRGKLNGMKEGKSLFSKISSALGGKSDVVALKDILYAIEKGEQYVHIAKDMELVRQNPVLMCFLKELADLGDPIANALISTK